VIAELNANVIYAIGCFSVDSLPCRKGGQIEALSYTCLKKYTSRPPCGNLRLKTLATGHCCTAGSIRSGQLPISFVSWIPE
jgi:hypothetical protein